MFYNEHIRTKYVEYTLILSTSTLLPGNINIVAEEVLMQYYMILKMNSYIQLIHIQEL